ncbi:MAG TPA: CCA tRNA nucleotidyltransferase [Candidatus Acidoferrales bacterium]|nr:CCA tRNA nucleotidyltransferase [Candidatus Acidoferrales bacterium]
MEANLKPRELAQQICSTLSEHGHQAYLVGGCVRDLLLQREPADYDVATDAVPARVEELFPGGLTVGAKFGVVIVPRDGAQVEVATFRSDVGYSDGRHPDHVVYSRTAQEDVRRRDFTINGLLMDPATGEVLDFVGGRDDLSAGVIRTIGDPGLRFSEDKLRLARTVRFAARFGYTIEPQTFAAIRKLAAQIVQVSAERLRDELTKLLTEGAARQGFELLDETGLLSILLPEIANMKGVAQPPEYHPEGDVWIHTRMLLEDLPPGCPSTLAWGALLHDVGKPATFKSAQQTGDRIRFDGHDEVGARMAEEICHRFRFSGDDTEQIVSLVASHMRFKDVMQMRPATLKRFVRLPRFDEHLELHRLDCQASHRMLGNWEYIRKFLAETPPEQVRPPRLLTGDDLMALGFQAGPAFKSILQSVEDAQLEGRLRTKDEAVQFVKAEFLENSPN